VDVLATVLTGATNSSLTSQKRFQLVTMAPPNHQILQPPVGHSLRSAFFSTLQQHRDRIKFDRTAVNFLYTVSRRGKDQAFAMTSTRPQRCRLHRDTGFAAHQFENGAPAGATAVYDAFTMLVQHLSNPPRLRPITDVVAAS